MRSLNRYTSLAAALLLGSCDSSSLGLSNRPPTFSQITSQTVNEGKLLSVYFIVSDPDEDPLTVSLTQGPGTLVTRAKYDYQDTVDTDIVNNQYLVELTVTDNKPGGTVTTTFQITQQDWLPEKRTGRKILLTSGLETIVLDRFGNSNGLAPHNNNHRSNQTAIAVDNQGKPLIAYLNVPHNTLVSIEPFQNVWVKSLIVFDVSGYLSLQFDSANIAHLAYENAGLHYAQYQNNMWTTTNIDPGFSTGNENELTLDINGNVHISYLNPTFVTSLEHAVRYATNKTGSWIYTEIAPAARHQTSIVTDQNNIPHIAYVDTNMLVNHATLHNGQWQITPLQTGTSPVIRKD